MIFKLLGSILLLIGVILIYNSRKIVKKIFDFGDENEAASGMKILGFVVCMLGSLIIYFNL